MKISINLRR